MTFTLEQWQKEARAKYGQLTTWLAHHAQNAGFAAYGGLTAFTLWPLVAHVVTAAQTGQPLPVTAILTLGSVAGAVGSNLLAAQIQDWYAAAARGDSPTEADLLDWLEENALTQEDVRADLDHLLEKLEAIPNAQAALPANEWLPFAQQLRQELQQLGSLSRFQAQLNGGGAIAQGEGAVAVGKQGIYVAGSVAGSIITGNEVTYYEADPTQPDADSLRRAYLSRLLERHNELILSGVDPKAVADDSALALSAVYTALLTESVEQDGLEGTTPDKQRQPRRFSALEQLNRWERLVLLGDPGSGKSTFVNFVAVCLAGEELGHPQLNLKLLTQPLPLTEEEKEDDRKKEPPAQPWDHQAPLPVCITLRDFAASPSLPPADQPATARSLWDYIQKQLETASLGEYGPLLKKELLQEGGLLLFDGLDEVPAADQRRAQIKQVVEDVARTYAKCRILVTSRTYAYQKQEWRLSTFADTVLAPFNRAQIEQFITRWYTHVGQARRLNLEDAQGRATLLKQAIFSNQRLYDLVERPLLLTLTASLHAWRGGSLPENREELYADAVDLLLDAWERQRITRQSDGETKVIQPSLKEWLRVDRTKVRDLLNRLAYEAHASQPELVGTADIPEEKLVMGLMGLSDDKRLQPKELIEFLSNRAGLLLPHGVGVYTFPHRTFQEYLAACHLTHDAHYPAEAAKLAREEPNRWREAALLAGAKAARGSAYALWGLVDELCPQPPGDGQEADYWGARLAGQLLTETADLTNLTAARQRQVDRTRDWLRLVLTNPVLPAIERAAAGRHLAQLGDPRPEVTDLDAMQFAYIPPGDFYMGEGDRPERQSWLDYPYWLGRYPVTCAHYMTFVNEDGYADPQWWAEAVAADVWRNGAYTGWGEPRTAPKDYGRSFQQPNQPVVGVSWYEALAFTKWLTVRWQQWLPAGWRVVLPSEAEWEKAARGGVKLIEPPLLHPISKIVAMETTGLIEVDNPDARRPYPWLEKELTPEQANYNAGEINQPNAVGCYAPAVAASGCEEMAGNVFEWTRSLDKKYPYDPKDGREELERGRTDWTVLRGGSWAAPAEYLRCGARDWHLPCYDLRDLGFRLALSPFFDSGR